MESTRPTEERMRWTISSFDISNEKMATGSLWTAALIAMPSARELLPIAGLAAMTTRLAAWRPASFLSRST